MLRFFFSLRRMDISPLYFLFGVCCLISSIFNFIYISLSFSNLYKLADKLLNPSIEFPFSEFFKIRLVSDIKLDSKLPNPSKNANLYRSTHLSPKRWNSSPVLRLHLAKCCSKISLGASFFPDFPPLFWVRRAGFKAAVKVGFVATQEYKFLTRLVSVLSPAFKLSKV